MRNHLILFLVVAFNQVSVHAQNEHVKINAVNFSNVLITDSKPLRRWPIPSKIPEAKS